jgi:hypothetical protein
VVLLAVRVRVTVGDASMRLLKMIGFTRARRFGMRTILYSVVAIAAVVATIVIWSKPVVIGPQVTRASVASTAEQFQPSEAVPRISPLEIMAKHGRNLPIEYWSDPF